MNNDLVRRKDVEQMLASIGGCDASEEWEKGWDEAIDAALDELRKVNTKKDWIPFTFEKDGEFNCKVPDEDEEVLVSDGKDVWLDVFSHDEHGYFFEWKGDFKGMAWMPKPQPWEGEKLEK